MLELRTFVIKNFLKFNSEDAIFNLKFNIRNYFLLMYLHSY